MKRGVNNKKTILTQEETAIIGSMIARTALASRLGLQSYGGDRNIQQTLGYLNDIKYEDYYARYLRQDIAKAIIDRPVKATWQGDLELEESTKAEETALEKAFAELNKRLGLKTIFSRVDRLTGIGNYGVLLLGLGDVKSQEDWKKEAIKKSELVYIKPFGQNHAKIQSFVTDPKNPRYGLPEFYSITIINEGEGVSTSTSIEVHYSRVLHIVDDVLESDIEGNPRLESVFNRLMDIEKLVGGDAEMFWRGARPGYNGKVDEGVQMTTAFQDSLKEQIDEYEHNLRRILMMDGVELKSLAQQIADPTGHVDVQIKMISSVTQIPYRILIGSERGELASGQDADEWDSFVQNRREEHAEPHIVRLFVDRCIELKILPAAGEDGYNVKWSDLFAESEMERVEVGQKRSNALAAYLNGMGQDVIPPDAFFEFFLGLSSEQIDLIKELRDKEVIKEETIEEEIEETPSEEVVPEESEEEQIEEESNA